MKKATGKVGKKPAFFRQGPAPGIGNKESACVAYWETTISQPSFDASPIPSPLISKEVNKKHEGTWLL
jgi:hypothetical protein